MGFTVLAALLAMSADAVVAHAMMWGNDPYWSYWLTDLLLMTTVFGVGTAWFGIGVGRGAVMTAVHITLLTAYYWTLAPIGLPAHPEWLDLQRTWVTGLPIHFAVYFLGYVVAFWLWRRLHEPALHPSHRTGALATRALVSAVGIVVAAGLLQWLLFREFPGVTWFVMRIAVATPITAAWWALAGTDRVAAISGGITLGFLLAAYAHYLAPVGLPNAEFRVLAENPPPAAVHWLSYRQEFLVILPLTVILAVAGYLLALRPFSATEPRRRGATLAVLITAAALALLGAVIAPFTGTEAAGANIVAGNAARLAPDPTSDAALVAGSATLRLGVTNRNSHRTPLPPHDLVDLTAEVADASGATYTVQATEPMVAEPRGLFITWSGVGFGEWHHGRSGIGYASLPPTFSDVAVYAVGTISAAGQPLAAGVPIHVFTSEREGARLELHVGDTLSPIPGLPGGYLRVVWPEYEGGHSRALTYARYAFGGGVLLALLGFALAGALREPYAPSRAEA